MSEENTYEFVSMKKMIELGMAFMISTQITNVSNKFIDNIIAPTVESLFTNNIDIDLLKSSILGVELEYGSLIHAILKLLSVLMIIYVVTKYSPLSIDEKFISKGAKKVQTEIEKKRSNIVNKN
jgi:large-conductance mechanosensitive channel